MTGKTRWMTGSLVGLGLMLGSIGAVDARPRYDRGYDRGYDRNYDRGYDRGYDRAYGFDEREYLRCNPDVRRAVRRGTMESGIVHYQVFGRREGRRLSC